MDKENLPERQKRRASAESALQLLVNSPGKRKPRPGKTRGLSFKKGDDDRRRRRSASAGSTEEVELAEEARVSAED